MYCLLGGINEMGGGGGAAAKRGTTHIRYYIHADKRVAKRTRPQTPNNPHLTHAGVHEIDQEDRDKIVFLTAGIAVLSLLVNGTTTGPLVRFLKLDRCAWVLCLCCFVTKTLVFTLSVR